MRRSVDMSQISDGRFYGSQDMAKLGCRDCRGCSACCHDIEGLFLDPLDVYRLTLGTGRSLDSFVNKEIVLEASDGLILPKMQMREMTEGEIRRAREETPGRPREWMPVCPFLSSEKRCSIHAFRPSICRLYPLGRYYEDQDFKYFLQTHECEMPGRYKMKVEQWVDEPEPEKNRLFVNLWHDFRGKIEEAGPRLTEQSRRQVLTYILQLFYMTPYQKVSFYPQFAARMNQAREQLAPLLGE